MIDRRTLLRLLLATAAAEATDFERLLWVPKPMVTVPQGRIVQVSLYDASGVRRVLADLAGVMPWHVVHASMHKAWVVNRTTGLIATDVTIDNVRYEEVKRT